MPYLALIVSNILSAAVSAAVTVYLLRYFILKHKDEFFGDFKNSREVKELRDETIISDIPTDIPQKSNAQVRTTEESILSSFTQTEKVPRTMTISLNYFIKAPKVVSGFFVRIFKKLNFVLHKAVHLMSTRLDRFLMFTFCGLATVLGFLLVPAYRLFYKLRAFSPGLLAVSIYKKYKDMAVRMVSIRLERLKKKQEERDLIALLEQSKNLDTKESKVQKVVEDEVEKIIPEKKNIPHNPLDFAAEVYLAALFIVATFLPFTFKIHQTYPRSVLLYCLLLLCLGAYTLLNKASPRVFWAIGISMWVMLAMWYFEGTSVAQVGSVVIFLCSFLTVYAVSSFIWYGLRGLEATPIEYGLFVLHPFLYLAGIYLLLVADSKSFVIILCAAVSALYVYFAEEVKNKKLVSKINTDFVYTSHFVAIVALLALVCVSTRGFLTISILSAATLLYIRFAKKIEITFLALLLLTIFGQTLGTTNINDKYSFLANERFVSYVTAASLFIYVINISRFRKQLLSGGVRTFTTIMLAFTVFLGATVEVLDAKVNSDIFTKGLPEIILAGIYLLISGWLFYRGGKDKTISIKVTAVLFSLYSLYFIVTRLLG